MSGKIKIFITNFSYTLISNLFSLIVSTLIVIVVPKLIGVNEFGYWQLYIFYTSFLGFFNIGWVEGIYLRYGGETYNSLNRKIFASQFWSFLLYIIFMGSLIIIYSFFVELDYNRQFILQMVSICLVLSVPRGFLLFILQSTNRIKVFARLTIADRTIYIGVIILMLAIGIREYKLLIIADLVGKTFTLIFSVYSCKDIVFSRFASFKDSLNETKKNITVGIKLLLSNLASLLIIGVVRFGIVHSWNIETFGKVSLTLSISNLMMVFVNAIGIIMFPILRQTNEKKLSSIYITMRDLLMIILLGILIMYYPLKLILLKWLPNYEESMKYMALVFPMVIYEGKMSLLINTYLKTLRKEKMLLKINLAALALSIFLTVFGTIIFQNLNFTILSIVFILGFKTVLAEVFLSKILLISLRRDIVFELILTLIFILTAWFINSWFSTGLYGSAYLIYLIIKKKNISSTIYIIKKLIRTE